MIYLAQPYSHHDPAIRQWRFEQGCMAAASLMGDGEMVHAPIVHGHPIAQHGDLPTDYAFWESLCRWYVERCREVVVLTLPGWRESVGVQAEIDMARENGKNVRLLPWPQAPAEF